MNSRLNLPLLILFAVAVAAGFWLFNPYALYFLNDDFIHIPLSKDGVLFQRKSFRPICDLSIAFDYFLWKKNAVGYHITNVLLHVFNTLLVYLFSVRLHKRYSSIPKWINIGIATLFFIYPFHSESIYWIIGRSGSLGTLFFLLSSIFYLKRKEDRLAFTWSALFFSIGLLTYESIWIFPMIAFFISWKDAKDNANGIKKEAKYCIVLFIVFFVFLLVRYITLGELVGDYEASGFKNIHVVELVLNGVRLVVRSFTPPMQSAIGFYLALGLILLTVTYLFFIFLNKKSKRLLPHLIACFLISLLPYLSLGIDTHGVEGERFLYLPSVFACVFLINFIVTIVPKQNIQILVFAFVFGYCIFFLSASQKKYFIASNITRKTMVEINLIKGKSLLYVDSLPEEYEGALIFRLGFKEGVQWIGSESEIKNITVTSSKSNWNKLPEHYNVNYKDTSYFSYKKILTSTKNAEDKAAIFFEDSCMIVVK